MLAKRTGHARRRFLVHVVCCGLRVLFITHVCCRVLLLPLVVCCAVLRFAFAAQPVQGVGLQEVRSCACQLAADTEVHAMQLS